MKIYSNYIKYILIFIQLQLIDFLFSNKNSTGEFKLSLDSKWKFSITSTDGGATLKKGLPNTPVDDDITALVGGQIRLPCDVNPPTRDDHPYLVILSKGTVPVYSIDARTGQKLENALHWKGTIESGIQEYSLLNNDLFSGFLLKGIMENAAGDYFCRVDFETSPTRNRRIKLNVIVPPKKMIILNELQEEVTKSVGPYPENSSLRLECIVYGGKPPPSVTWWHKGEMIDGHVETRRGDATINVLTFDEITRKNLFTTISCQANNSNLAPPLKSSLEVDMLFPPNTVKIKDNNVYLKEGQVTSYTCDSEGSKPPAKITWWKNEFQLNDTKELILHDGNSIRSVVQLMPTIDDDQAILTCRAQNPLLSPMSVVEDARRLIVHYAPRLSLLPGQMMNMSRVTDGDDVYLECKIVSQPKENIVRWYHEGKQILSNKTAGIIQSHQSLVLQKVKKVSSGNYTCEASNPVGTSQSNVLLLSVKFIPICAKNQQFVYGGGNEQLVNVSCKVEAYPDPSEFRWAFNTSAEHADIPKNLTHSEGTRSMISYKPLTHLDFGSLLCWAHNEIGEQKLPCVFQVVPASPPEAPNNCSVWHEAGTAGEVVVACRPGWDGGLPQNFSLEVRLKGGGEILAALRGQPVPHFTVTGLAPGTEYLLVILASNSQGVAPPVKIVHLTPIDIAEKRLSATSVDGKISEDKFNSLVAVLCGVFSALLICFIFIIVLIKVRMKRRNEASAEVFEPKLGQSVDVQIGDSVESQDNLPRSERPTKDTSSKRKFPFCRIKRKHSGIQEDLIPKSENLTEIHSPSSSNLVVSESSPLVASNPLFHNEPPPSNLPVVTSLTSGRCYPNKHSLGGMPIVTMETAATTLPIKQQRTFAENRTLRTRLSSIDTQFDQETCLNTLRNMNA